MANEDIESLLKSGIEAAKARNKQEARRLLEQVLELDDSNQAAWMWLATVVDKPSEKRICLENVLELNPNNLRAQEALAQLGPAPQQSPGAPKSEKVDLPLPRKGAAASKDARQAQARSIGNAAAGPRPTRRRISPVIFIGGGLLAIIMIVGGLFLAANQLAPTPTPTRTAVPTIRAGRPGTSRPGAVAVAASPTLVPVTPNGTIVTAVPVTVAADTPTSTDTPFPTLTPSPTLPALSIYKLIFTGDGRRTNAQTLYSIQGDGTGETPFLASSSGATFSPALSRTGKLAYIGIDADKEQLFVADQKGQNAKPITKFSGEHLSSPVWSPDGSKIALTVGAPGGKEDPSTREIYIVDSSGASSQKLTNNTFEDRDPAWEPNGNALFFASDPTNSKSLQLVSYDFTSKKITAVTNSTGDNYSPSWSPDGAYVAFVSTRDRYPNIYIINIDDPLTVKLVSINGGSSTNRDPAWSPDGKYIAFASDRGSSVFNLYITTPDGKFLKQLTNVPPANATADSSKATTVPSKDNSYEPVFLPGATS